jgi:DNA anti-recombination protein RmuC
MLGILGCFLGIATGLFHFDTTNVQNSVPSLLDGIKTSFWASIAGIVGALTIKARCLLFGPPGVSHDEELRVSTIDDLARLLQSLQQSVAGKEDSTLLSQMKLLRQETGDGLKILNSNLENYMERMADNNSKALIEALKEVIRDFNAKINEQFGDNFKELNSAVERILVWQEAYRQQMAEIIDLQRAATENMSIAAARYSELVQQAERFSIIATELSALLTGLETQREHLHGALTHLGNLLKAAGDGVPRLEEKITELTRQIEASVRNTGERLAAASGELARSVQDSHAEMRRILTESAADVHREVNSHVQQLSTQTRDQVVALDKALSEELTKSIRTLGEHLTALSRRFVEDYTPLTERLRSLLHLVT